jgi:hypothetical protein
MATMADVANDNSRRAFLRGAAAAAALAAPAAAGAAAAGASASIGRDAAHVAAEREILAILAEIAALPKPQTRDEAEAWSDATDARWWRIDALEALIYGTPVESLTGAAVKIRRLLDPRHGIEAGVRGDAVDSLAHILAVIERRGGPATP